MSGPYPPSTTTVQTVSPGAVVQYTPKNPFTTWRWWGLIVLILSVACDAAIQKGWLTPEDKEGLLSRLPLLGEIAGIIVTGWGAWNAKRPLGFTNELTPPSRIHALLPVLLMPALLLGTGCMPVAEHVAWREAVENAQDVSDDEFRTFCARLLEGDGTMTVPEIASMTPQQRADWYEARILPLDEYEAGLAEDRNRYSNPFQSRPVLPSVPPPVPPLPAEPSTPPQP
jgi:hypothetical protein